MTPAVFSFAKCRHYTQPVNHKVNASLKRLWFELRFCVTKTVVHCSGVCCVCLQSAAATRVTHDPPTSSSYSTPQTPSGDPISRRSSTSSMTSSTFSRSVMSSSTSASLRSARCRSSTSILTSKCRDYINLSVHRTENVNVLCIRS